MATDTKTQVVNLQKLGLVSYEEALSLQKQLFQSSVEIKTQNKKLPAESQKSTSHSLLVCQHPHVYTLGRSGDKENLLVSDTELEAKGATFYEIGRGGDITYHGPGQLVAYPIFDLDNFFTDIHKYLRYLEEAVIMTLSEYGIKAGRIDGLTGVWIDFEEQLNPRKICAFGVKASRWITMHGLALNVNTDLSYFGNIVPCGIQDKAVTSIAQELGREVPIEEVEDKLVGHMSQLFGFQLKK